MYLKGGMGDGGSCHPRDNIALSYLSKKLKNKLNFFDFIMKQREASTEWLVNLIHQHAKGRKIVILGKAFKANTNMIDGSPSVLLSNLLKEEKIKSFTWDPHIDTISYKQFLVKNNIINHKKLFFIATAHHKFINFKFEKNSKVLDPWGLIGNNQADTLISLGRNINVNDNIL
jgi:UDPglucose 6-dehydrogenase